MSNEETTIREKKKVCYIYFCYLCKTGREKEEKADSEVKLQMSSGSALNPEIHKSLATRYIKAKVFLFILIWGT